MSLTKLSQDLRRELKTLGLDLEQAASEVLSLTKGCQGAEVVAALKLIGKPYEDADRLAAHADEVKASQVMRAEPE